MLKLGFLASHAGSNVQAIVEACRTGGLDAEPCVVVSNNSRSGALKKARAQGIATYHLSERTHPGALDEIILATMRQHGVEVVCLAGYMKSLGLRMLATYGGRILNVHPSLLPKSGGQGMYGLG
ncbi:MAG: phosphoribosylglycinamide formyltransferase, partial [Gemmatimonadetes bacterium]|nr:phosphoribosylglycinamide formyltransferase [Gemmatimonadota bacterium]